MNIYVTSSKRVGSTWTCDMLADILKCNWVFREQVVDFKTDALLTKIHHAHPSKIVRQVPRVIGVTRNVLDVITSMIFYIRYDRHLDNIPRLNKLSLLRKRCGGDDKTDKDWANTLIKNEKKQVVKWVENWKRYEDGYTHPRYHLIRYEELKTTPLKTLKSACNFLGLNVSSDRIKSVIYLNKMVPSKHNKGFRRKGVIGDWKNYLDDTSVKIILGVAQ